MVHTESKLQLQHANVHIIVHKILTYSRNIYWYSTLLFSNLKATNICIRWNPILKKTMNIHYYLSKVSIMITTTKKSVDLCASPWLANHVLTISRQIHQGEPTTYIAEQRLSTRSTRVSHHCLLHKHHFEKKKGPSWWNWQEGRCLLGRCY